jgi:hypothetical protein
MFAFVLWYFPKNNFSALDQIYKRKSYYINNILKVLILVVLFICRFGTNGYQKSWGSVDDNFLGVGTVVGYVKGTVA